MTVKNIITIAALVTACSVPAWGQQPVTKGDMKKTTVTIQALDVQNRIITFRLEDGTEEMVYATPEVKRFDALKVGDRVNLTYYESQVFAVRRPGAPEPKPVDKTAVTPGPGSLPGGTMARQTTTSVTVKAVDPSVPSITVTTAGGRTIIRKVAQKSYLDGVKPGDKIDITTTEALLASVEPAK